MSDPTRILRPRRLAAAALLAGLAGAALPGMPAWGSAGPTTSVIVREGACAGAAPERAVERAGGQVTRQLGIIGGFSARVPSGAVARLRVLPCVESVTADVALRLHGDGGERDDDADDEGDERGKPAKDAGSMADMNAAIGAAPVHRQGHGGQGVDVALIDSGVTPVPGLSGAGKLVHGPDLSFESQDPDRTRVDGFGHGTHMAGIIAGADDAGWQKGKGAKGSFYGVAPAARLVSVKVASSNGATDVSQVIAAIDWVVQHGQRDGLNIRVLNLSFGTQSCLPYSDDPLAFDAEVAWRKGIVVVAAAGNDGDRSGRLTNPAYDPFVVAVGAVDTKGTKKTNDDAVLDFSSRGDGIRNPDVVAPGRSVQSLRVPGSTADLNSPSARASDRFVRGSGSSQSAAMVSGAAAVLLGQRPELSPDQVKALLTSTADPLGKADAKAQGAGLVDLARAVKATPPASAAQPFTPSTGTGSLEAARGGAHVYDAGGVALDGERDIFGTAFDAAAWAREADSGTSWREGQWNGMTWSGMTWSGMTWSGMTWSGMTWSGMTWSGMRWSGMTWSGMTWSGMTWSGMTWG